MRISRRTLKIQGIENEIEEFILKHDGVAELTEIEFLSILNRIQARILKYALRSERHPENPDRPADVD